MPFTITMPQLGETVTEGTILSWVKEIGEYVAEDDILVEISTDKVDTEVPSPHEGVLTEILVAASTKLGIETGIDPLKMMDIAEDIVRPLQPTQGVIDRDGLLLGYAGVYGSFLLHAKRAAEQFDVETKDILMALGERKVVGGQEDMIIDVAVELQRAAAKPRR